MNQYRRFFRLKETHARLINSRPDIISKSLVNSKISSGTWNLCAYSIKIRIKSFLTISKRTNRDTTSSYNSIIPFGCSRLSENQMDLQETCIVSTYLKYLCVLVKPIEISLNHDHHLMMYIMILHYDIALELDKVLDWETSSR